MDFGVRVLVAQLCAGSDGAVQPVCSCVERCTASDFVVGSWRANERRRNRPCRIYLCASFQQVLRKPLRGKKKDKAKAPLSVRIQTRNHSVQSVLFLGQ